MPAALEDPTQPPHYRGPDVNSPQIEPYTALLKDGQTTATIYPISSAEQLPIGLLAFLCDEFNEEIERGDTYPLFDTLHIETFQNYWFGSFAGVMIIGNEPTIQDQDQREWEKVCLGTFHIKPNYPGRSSHICTAGFLVNAGIRRKGIGRTLAECFLEWAPKLGYTYSVFNLVFETNIAARRIWETLGFKRIGRVKGAGILKGHEHAIDALIYGRELVEPVEETVGELRFDKIRYYLETGRYPPQSDRQEKSRLRSSAAHYSLKDGRLMLKDREVVAESERQLQIATELHMQSHAGINKTTSQITEKYHWTRIKETVAQAIRNCAECRETSRPPPKRIKKDYNDEDEVDMHSAAAQAVAVATGIPLPNSNSSNQHLSHHERRSLQGVHDASSLLTNDLNLDTDDPNGLIAAVTAAQHHQQQQQQHQQHQQQQHRHHQPPHQQGHHQAYQPDQHQQQQLQHHLQQQGRRSQKQQLEYNTQYQQHHFQDNHDHDIPVDPQVESAFEEHVHGGGEEMAIATALIQANREDQDDDNNNLFS